MKKQIKLLLSPIALIASLAFAVKNDGSDIPECAKVVQACTSANVSATDRKTGKTIHGYQVNEHKLDGKGLWHDCIDPLASGKSVEGVSGITQDEAKVCAVAEKKLHPHNATKN